MPWYTPFPIIILLPPRPASLQRVALKSNALHSSSIRFLRIFSLPVAQQEISAVPESVGLHLAWLFGPLCISGRPDSFSWLSEHREIPGVGRGEQNSLKHWLVICMAVSFAINKRLQCPPFKALAFFPLDSIIHLILTTPWHLILFLAVLILKVKGLTDFLNWRQYFI